MWQEYLHHEYKGVNPNNFQQAFEADWRKVIPEAAMPKDAAGDVLAECRLHPGPAEQVLLQPPVLGTRPCA